MDVEFELKCENCDEETRVVCNFPVRPEVCPVCGSADVEIEGGLDEDDE